MSRILKKHVERVAAAEADLNKMNCNCLPPFEKEGVMMSSYLCSVGKGRNFPLYTYVYAPNKEVAQTILDDQYKDFDIRTVITENE